MDRAFLLTLVFSGLILTAVIVWVIIVISRVRKAGEYLPDTWEFEE